MTTQIFDTETQCFSCFVVENIGNDVNNIVCDIFSQYVKYYFELFLDIWPKLNLLLNFPKYFNLQESIKVLADTTSGPLIA